ncbi:MAG TPA: hypothetical protein VHL31_11620 [Geminicoccus sp.]|jgi:hypothetical protein|uniref:hypothetical protein n=1 Tax=Geminicoccus sp. TaxID=2024832 RepID=UPI002E330FAA|nr:hypothetical protein [Geminicoccus sp.]HEX2526928.1 hypothetical protein [Geminicoccus sp.]
MLLAVFAGAGVAAALPVPELPAQIAPTGGNGLLGLWYERCRHLQVWLDYGESRDRAHEQVLYRAWADLDHQIIHTRALTLEDLQAKLALQRDWLEVAADEVVTYPGDLDHQESELDADAFLILSIISYIERMFQGELA